MRSSPVHPVLKFLRRMKADEPAGESSDGALLARFVARRDEDAFTALVQRHGPLVLGVCHRVLRDAHDADDAFQATFLVLARRAGSIGRPELLGNWLYGVAYRTALRARAIAARRRAELRPLPEPAVADATEAVAWRDLRPVLDEELSRLPDKYRAAVVLCDLEGQTHEEAARRLGCPRETVTTRLARARARLRARLARRGVALSGVVLAALLSREAASAALLDPKKTPKWIDITASDKKTGREVKALGIYEVKGDTLKLCMVEEKDGNQRPTEFVGQGKPILIVFKRVPEKEPVKPPAARP